MTKQQRPEANHRSDFYAHQHLMEKAVEQENINKVLSNPRTAAMRNKHPFAGVSSWGELERREAKKDKAAEFWDTLAIITVVIFLAGVTLYLLSDYAN